MTLGANIKQNGYNKYHLNNIFLSIVIVGRNDNYGGDFTDRLRQCVQWNTQLLEKYKISSEFVIVNWNPIAENKSLENLIDFQQGQKYVSFRIVTVSPEIHEQFINPDLRETVPVFEFIAKNVGIRRAKGEYILCINADILIHQRIFKFIAANKLSRYFYYRANRFDFRKNENDKSLGGIYKSGYVVSMKGFFYYFSSFIDKRIQYSFFRIVNRLRIAFEFWKFRNQKLSNFLRVPVTYNNASYYTHCHNSGDFMLMHHEFWQALKGYPEYTQISTHTDALFTIFSFVTLKEYVFSQPIFHQEHERRYTWDDMNQDSMFLSIFAKFEKMAQEILKEKSAVRFLNNNDWGLQNFLLPEVILNKTE